jgi:hypothetical protein
MVEQGGVRDHGLPIGCVWLPGLERSELIIMDDAEL